MAWQETRVVDSRMMFVVAVLKGDCSMLELCESFGISRKSGYKWLERYAAEGPVGLEDRSRAPLNHPNAISDEVREAILAAKSRFCHWGPLKIGHWLWKRHPDWAGHPAASTIGVLLKSRGLVRTRSRPKRPSPTQPPLTQGNSPNEVWCTDFKGHFQTKDGHRCNPLTVSDQFSRYLLCCQHLDTMSYESVRRQFERAFGEFGLPLVMRTDNGQPFSCYGLGGLTKLSAWWVRLGIHPERIEPGKPQQNGRHERMHRTLKEHTACPPAKGRRSQQRSFDEFIDEFNQERPHEAIGMRTPASIYVPSPREMPSRLEDIAYPDGMAVRKVAHHGDIRYRGRRLFVNGGLCHEYVGIERVDDDTSRLWYCNYELGTLDHRKWQIEPAKCCPLSAGASPCTAHNSKKVLPMSPV
jgi:transposase InsO family protein